MLTCVNMAAISDMLCVGPPSAAAASLASARASMADEEDVVTTAKVGPSNCWPMERYDISDQI